MSSTSAHMSSAETLRERYQRVRERIAAAAARSDRTADQIALIAVSKYAEPDQIRELIQLGHVDFGESQVQQLLQRAAIIDEWVARHRSMPSATWASSLRGAGGVRWHMIGHLQRNKVRKAAEVCRLIHSVDSLRLAEEIQAVAAKLQSDAERRGRADADGGDGLGRRVDVLLQVNVSGERSKFGCSVPAALHLAEQIDTMIQLRLRGLMTMAPYSANPEEARPVFARLREVFEEIRDAGIAPQHFNILSMGMSGDYEVAIEEGSNMVRVGTGIFGEPRVGVGESGEGPESDA